MKFEHTVSVSNPHPWKPDERQDPSLENQSIATLTPKLQLPLDKQNLEALRKVSAMTSQSITLGDHEILAGFSLTEQPDGAATGKVEVVQSRHPIEPERFVPIAKQILAKLDPEGKGVTREQMANAMEDLAIRGEQAQVLAAMYHNFSRLCNIDTLADPKAHKGFGMEDPGGEQKPLTTADLDKYDEIRQKEAPALENALDMRDWARLNFDSYAQGGKLTREVIDKALIDSKTPEEDKSGLRKIQKNWIKLGAKDLTQNDFESYLEQTGNGTFGARLVSSTEFVCRRVSMQAKSPGEPYTLYGTEDPIDSIKPQDVKQGLIGDCFFDGALAAVAGAHPEMIRNSIRDNHNGTYTVTFPGAPKEPVTVTAPTEAELGLYNAGTKDGIWPAVMERAFCQYRVDHPGASFLIARKLGPNQCEKDGSLRGNPDESSNTIHDGSASPKKGRFGTVEEASDDGGSSAPVLRLLTGKDSECIDLKCATQNFLDTKLRQAFQSKTRKAVTSEIGADYWDTRATSKDGFHTRHLYTIIGYETDEKNGGKYVTVRNPWGGRDNTTDGTMRIPLKEFMNNFTGVTIEM